MYVALKTEHSALLLVPYHVIRVRLYFGHLLFLSDQCDTFFTFAGQDMVPKPPLQVQEAGQGESDVREFSKQSGKNLVL